MIIQIHSYKVSIILYLGTEGVDRLGGLFN